jgi:hypothetical protein
VILFIKADIYKIVDVVVQKVKDGVDITLNLLSGALNYVWNGIVSFARQVFDVVDSLFTSIGCAFEKLFGWLCYLLDSRRQREYSRITSRVSKTWPRPVLFAQK